MAADVIVAVGRRERFEDRFVAPENFQVAADHQAVAELEAPDAAAGAGIDEMQLLRGEHGGAADVVVKVGIAAVDDRVAGLEQLRQLVDRAFGRIARGHHHPYAARRLEPGDEVLQRIDAVGAEGRDFFAFRIVEVERDDLMIVAPQPFDHVHAHFAETNESDFHQACLPLGIQRYDPDLRPRGGDTHPRTPRHLTIRRSI